MKSNNHLEKRAADIADEIVELVERTNGPVTLARIHREIEGFAKQEPPARLQVVNTAVGEMVIWDGMTEAGNEALRKVMYERMVAIQSLLNKQPYRAEGFLLEDKNWLPIVLLPARAANLESPNWLIRASQGYQDFAIVQGRPGHRRLKPGPVRSTADQFSV